MIKVTFWRCLFRKRSSKLPDLTSFSGFNFKTQKVKESEQGKETHVQEILFHGTGL